MTEYHRKKVMNLRIKSIEVDNFKSLVNFRLDIEKFSCLIGLNGSGKSTVLQFMDFVAHLVRKENDWLKRRHWNPTDLRSKLAQKRKDIKFCIRFVDSKGAPAGRWEATYNPSSDRCTAERIDMLDWLLETEKDTVSIYDLKGNDGRKNWKTITFDYRGSYLSTYKEELLPPSILMCKKFFQETESLELLTPERLRQRTRLANGSLGHGGRNLSAFVYELGSKGRVALAKKLKPAYRQLERVYAKQLRSGWKQLRISEIFNNVKVRTDAAHVNDGMLRVVAILAELASTHCFLLFDEIENGINPELVEFVTDALVQASQQIFVTTHSPMILNYLDDEVAQKGVIYLYKTVQGHTKSIPFFSIPSLKEKLQVMGPGEAFVDTDLTKLASEIGRMQKKRG